MNNKNENFMKWALEVVSQEYEGNVKEFTKAMEDLE